jgi:Na+-driven multidrug efflux pump
MTLFFLFYILAFELGWGVVYATLATAACIAADICFRFLLLKRRKQKIQLYGWN